MKKSQGCQFQDYHPYHTALDGRRLAVSGEADITVYFMDDVGDDERWESGRATIEGAGSANMNVNNTMLLEADKGPSINDVLSLPPCPHFMQPISTNVFFHYFNLLNADVIYNWYPSSSTRLRRTGGW